MLSRTHKLPLNSLHSLPKGFGGPIISSRESECLNIFFREIKKIFTQKNLFHHRIRTNDFYNLRFSKYLSKEGYVPNLNGCHMVINLKDKNYDDVISNFTKKRRWAIRKARDNKDLEVEEINYDQKSLKDFYNHYARAFNYRHKSKPYPFTFFKEMFLHFPNSLRIFTAKCNGKVAGSFFHIISDKESTVYHYFNTVYPEFYNLNVVELLHDYSIRWCLNNDYERYDLGGTGSNFEEGNFRFKSQFTVALPYLVWEKGKLISMKKILTFFEKLKNKILTT